MRSASIGVSAAAKASAARTASFTASERTTDIVAVSRVRPEALPSM